jgi:NADPH2:quinone reductase
MWRAGDVFKWLAAGELNVRVDCTMSLDQVAETHRLLKSRQTAGKILPAPWQRPPRM